MASSRRWATIISHIASFAYFLLIVFQVPLLRVPCGPVICTTPVEITSSQMIANGIVYADVAKAILYPGAVAKAIIMNITVPSYDYLLNFYGFTNTISEPVTTYPGYLEILAGSYLAVVGAIFGLLIKGRTSLYGTVLIIWGLIKDDMHRSVNADPNRASCIYLTMFIAVVSSFLSVRGDVRRIVRICRAWRVRKPPWVPTEAKHK